MRRFPDVEIFVQEECWAPCSLQAAGSSQPRCREAYFKPGMKLQRVSGLIQKRPLPHSGTQDEWRKNAQSPYMMGRLNACLTAVERAGLARRQILNCGIMGGPRATLLPVLTQFVDIMANIARTRASSECFKQLGPDMAAFNYLLYVPPLCVFSASAPASAPPATHATHARTRAHANT